MFKIYPAMLTINKYEAVVLVEWDPILKVLMLAVLMAFPVISSAADYAEESKVAQRVVMGWLETVFLEPYGLQVTAKLDTGAKTSSVNASHIEHYRREGKEWVRFSFATSASKKALILEKPLERQAKIKERTSRSTIRDVVLLVICKNGRQFETEFTLNDRSNFNYPLLLGRSFLEHVALVDSSETFLFNSESDSCLTGNNQNLPNIR
jgi:hypothetical protein